MAAGAGKRRVIRRVSMANAADPVSRVIAMIYREEGVVRSGERRRQPCRGGVASCARGRPSCRGVIGICSPREIRFVAGVAVSRCPRKDVVDVA